MRGAVLFVKERLIDAVVGREIVAGGEARAGATQDRDLHRGVGIGLLEGVQDRAAQLVVEGVAFLRSIQGQAAHAGERRVDDERG